MAETIKDLYLAALEDQQESLLLLIDFLVIEKKVLTYEDPASKLDYYFQDRFSNKLNRHLKAYREDRGY